VEAIRALVVAKRSARSAKIQTLNQIRHLSFTAPEQLRQRLAGVSRHHLAARAAALRPATREGVDPVIAAAKTALRMLGRRVLALDEEKARVDALLSTLVTQTAPPCSPCTAWASTPQRRCWSPPVTTRGGCGRRLPGRTCAAPLLSRRRRGR
jgi:hypothetical protein